MLSGVNSDNSNATLLHMDGTFADASGKAWTGHGNAAAYAAGEFDKAAIFDGSGDWIDTPASSGFCFGSGDFTVDFWIYPLSGGSVIFGQSSNTAAYATRSIDMDINTNGIIDTEIFHGSTRQAVSSTGSVPFGTWAHVAAVRSGNTYTQYINGVADGSIDLTGISLNCPAYKMAIGKLGEYPNYSVNGYIDEFRISSVARWMTDFTPPTEPYDPTPQPTPTPLGTGGTIPLSAQGTLHIFALMGQSNGVGWTNTPPANQPTSPTIWMFKAGRWGAAREPLTAANGYGPGMPFVLQLQTLHPDWNIGILSCALNSTSLGQWGHSYSEDTLYGACLEAARSASIAGHIDGVLMVQGEDDALGGSQYYHGTWGAHFEDWIMMLRSDTSPDLPVVFVQIGLLPLPGHPYTAEVRTSQAAVSIPGVVMIPDDGLATTDTIHRTIASQQTVGAEAADAMNGALP